MPNLEPGLTIGDYVLRRLLSKTSTSQTWLGEQVSVRREAEITCFFGDDQAKFLADLRVKAMVEGEIFGLVYEVVQAEGFIACASEVLPTKSVFQLKQEKKTLPPLKVNSIIHQVASALRRLEKQGIAWEDFTSHDLRLGEQGLVRMRNIARAGAPGDETSTRQAFAEDLRSLLEFGQPGATRMGTLLAYIEGTETQAPIPWAQADTLALQVDQQLRTSPIAPLRPQPVLTTSHSGRNVLLAALLFCGVAALVTFLTMRPKNAKIDSDLIITVPAGRYPRPNGGLVELSAFRLDSAEVSIKEYVAFLVAWQQMDATERQKLKGSSWPEHKISIRPLGWNTYYPLARTQGTWEGRAMSLECPVIGVDWWDASAYAKWKGGHLPTDQEWWAACSSSLADLTKNSAWGPVGGPEEKIYGLSGLVSEWAGNFSKDPSFPMNSPSPVLLGGSFIRTSKEALSRDWVESPSLRREDLGFRVAYSPEK